MTIHPNNSARSALVSPSTRRREGAAPSRTILCLLACALSLAAFGCGVLRHASTADPAAIVVSAEDASSEQVAAALTATREKMRLAPREPYWPFRLGEVCAAVDSTAQAVSHLRSALEVDPTYAPAAALLSKLFYEAGAFDEAVTLLEDFLSRNAGAPDALRAALALHLEALGELDRAHAVLDGCSDGSREARAARTFVSLRGDDLDAVLDVAARALETDPKSAANNNNYGIALLCAGRPLEAREAFLAALELDQRLPGALYNMAIVEAFYFFDEEAGREWFARYRQLASTDPDDLTSFFGTDLTRLTSPESAP